MKNWKNGRPDGWVFCRPVAQALEDIPKDEYGMVRALTPFEMGLFEAGADAMLRAVVKFIGGVFSEAKWLQLKREAGMD